MRSARPGRVLAALGLMAMLIAGVARVFEAYQDPVHLAQWLSVLQLCR